VHGTNDDEEKGAVRIEVHGRETIVLGGLVLDVLTKACVC
jgi:hypothetical protein